MKKLLLIFIICFSFACNEQNKEDEYLVSFTDTTTDEYGYKNLKGEIIIPLGKYQMCFSDTFKTYAIVLLQEGGYVAIDREEKILYHIFPFDNGPDYISEGMFRIIENNKIGFADAKSGEIKIKPQYDCAFPFENGVAKVSNSCTSQMNGEHNIWQSDNWFYIDKTGKQVEKSTEDNVELQSEITCPKCGHKKLETMPTDVCLIKYICEKCKTELRPKGDDCCVFCSYGTYKCPSMQ